MRSLIVSLTVSLLAGCLNQDRPNPCPAGRPNTPAYRRVESARIPVELRQRNYLDRNWQGSCVHASAITMLRWHGQYKAAAWWRRNGFGPAYTVATVSRMCRELELEYLCEKNGSSAFLEWVSRTRRAAVLHYQKGHTTTFVGFRGGQAIIIDNRWPATEVRIPKQQFLRSWRYYGGNAITLVAAPPPPKPWR